jgi:hypothetical protein
MAEKPEAMSKLPPEKLARIRDIFEKQDKAIKGKLN